MNAPSTGTLARPWYGAFELKRTYQRHLGLGVLWAAGIHIALIGGFLFYKWMQDRASAATEAPSVVIRSMSDIADKMRQVASVAQVVRKVGLARRPLARVVGPSAMTASSTAT